MFDEQLAWETEGITRGVARYHKMCEQVEGADTFVGREIGSEVIRPLVSAIRDAQLSLLLNRREGARQMAFCCLPPEEMAVIVIRQCISAAPRATTALALEIGAQCRLQRELALWRDASATKTRAAKERGEHAVDLYKLMVDKSKKVDARVFGRWRRKVGEFNRTDWDKTTRAWVGMNLMALLVQHGGGWFEFAMKGRTKGNRWVTERFIDLTALAREWVQAKHGEFEIARPCLAPMLVPPRDWVRVERNESEEPEDA